MEIIAEEDRCKDHGRSLYSCVEGEGEGEGEAVRRTKEGEAWIARRRGEREGEGEAVEQMEEGEARAARRGEGEGEEYWW